MPFRMTIRTLGLALTTSLLTCAASAATHYDAIYVFGDSYCDVGNIYFATRGATPPPPYYDGRFSNGPIWVEHVASALGLPLLPSLLPGGTDYALGGAEVTAPVSTLEGTILSVPEQVGEYLLAHGGHADPNALYILEGGGNDILAATGGSPSELGRKIARKLAESELLLRQAGARDFVIPDLFDVALLPAAYANASFASEASQATNHELDKLLWLEEQLECVKIMRVDVFSLFQSVAADATHYGFTNITTPCLNPTTGAVCADPDHTLFWDAEHPTEFGHSFFAVLLEQALIQRDKSL